MFLFDGEVCDRGLGSTWACPVATLASPSTQPFFSQTGKHYGACKIVLTNNACRGMQWWIFVPIFPRPVQCVGSANACSPLAAARRLLLLGKEGDVH